MGSSFIEYGGHGFEAADATIEVLLTLLVEEIDKLEEAPEWMREMRDDWHLQATAGFGFGVVPALDEYITDDSRRNIVLDLAGRALSTLETWEDPVSRDRLNALGTGGEGAIYTEDVPKVMFLRPVRYFIKLLEGRLETWENDARFEKGPPNS